MKKFTLLVAMLICVVGFSQVRSVNQLGPNNPTYANQVNANKQVQPSSAVDNVQAGSIGENNPVYLNEYTSRLLNLPSGVEQRRAESSSFVANGNSRPMYHAAGAQLVEVEPSLHSGLLSGDVSYSTYQPQLISNTSHNNGPVIIVNSMGPVSPYTDMATWQSDWGGAVTTEDFNGILGGPVCSSPTPITSAGNDCFSPGEIIDGISVDGNPGDNVVLDVGFLGNANPLVGANTFVDFGVVDFNGAEDAFAVGMLVFNNSDPNTDVRVYDTGGALLSTFTVNAAIQTEVFFGVISTEAIGSIEIEGANGSGELLGNLMIGYGSGGGGGGSSDCTLVGPGNGFENGKSCTQNLGRIVAHDFTVAADSDATLESFTPNVFIGASGSGVNAAFVDVYVWGDNGGAPDPGNLVASELGVTPTSQTVVGSNFGFDVWAVELDITDVVLPGQAGSDTTYWVGISLEATDGSNVFWENSTAGLIGFGEAYDDGVVGFVIDSTLEGVYTMVATCTGGGGGGTSDCTLVGPGNGFENGKSCTQNLGRIVAHDFTVAADSDATLESFTPNVFIGASGSGVNAAFVDVYVWGDNGGAPDPGNLVASELGLTPTSQTVVGSNFGFDVWAVELDITDVVLPGQAGSDTTYWVGISLEATDGSNVFWENSTAGLIGFGEAYDDGVVGFVIDSTLEGVYTMVATCTGGGGGGGGGNACSVTGPGNGFENGKSILRDNGWIVAHDIDVPADQNMMLEVINANVFAGAQGSGNNVADVDIYIWGDNGGAPDPGNLIVNVPGFVPTNQTVVGSNFGFDVWNVELDHPDVMLDGQVGATTKYWIGLSGVATDAGNLFWENSTAGLIGQGEAFNDGGGFVIDPTLEGVYTFTASCEDLEIFTYDDCEGALDISCGMVVQGSTIGATDDSAVAPDCDTPTTTPGVWYKFEDTSGLAADITITTCSANTDYDTKISVYTGECSNPPLTCVVGNDDDPNCTNFQSTVEFTSDGNTTYYILVHGFGGQTGNFELTMTCDFIPPPNDDIEDAIDLDEVGCPFTDEDVAMPAATEEDGTPTDCDITGANGVWYKFTPELDGQITGTIITPGGVQGAYLSVNNGPLAGNYSSVAADFGGEIPADPLTADAAVVIDDDTTGDPNDGCDPIDNGGDLSGKIAIVRRGACEFGLKALAAQNEGAVAVIVVNNQPGEPIVMGGGANGGDVTIPAVMVSDVDGEALISEILGGNTVNMTLVSGFDGFSSVTFYTAPDESSVEDELVLVDWWQNQCVPGATATIPVTAGQTYYCFVVNTGSVTDIVFDNCQLGTDSNEIEGFVFYPNPANDYLNLSATQNIENVALYNILGQRVIEMDVEATQTQVSVANLAAGAYIMHVTVDGQKGTYKVIKN